MRRDLGRGPWNLVGRGRGWGRFLGESLVGGIEQKFALEALPE